MSVVYGHITANKKRASYLVLAFGTAEARDTAATRLQQTAPEKWEAKGYRIFSALGRPRECGFQILLIIPPSIEDGAVIAAVMVLLHTDSNDQLQMAESRSEYLRLSGIPEDKSA